MRSAILLLCVLNSSAAAAQRASSDAADEAAIRTLVSRYTQARELRDPKAIEPLFTADADQYTSSGEWRRGRPQLVQGMLDSSTRNPGVRAIAIAEVRFVRADVAIVDGEYTTGSDGRQLWTTLTVTREGREWKIAAIRNMAPTRPVR